MDDEKNVLRAGEAFIERGAIPQTVRAEVVASWVRVDRPHAPLLTKARAVSATCEPELAAKGSATRIDPGAHVPEPGRRVLILTDPSGLILETAGDPRTREAGRGMYLERGGRWNEAGIGTSDRNRHRFGATRANSRLRALLQRHAALDLCRRADPSPSRR